jgi:hypothetical protein
MAKAVGISLRAVQRIEVVAAAPAWGLQISEPDGRMARLPNAFPALAA